MEPIIKTDKYELWLGDCLDVLPYLELSSAIVTDPPYGINWTRGVSGSKVKGRKASAVRHSKESIEGDSKPFDPVVLLDFSEVILFGANHYCHRLPEGKWHAWDKLHGWKSHDKNSDVEFIWQKGKPGAARIISYLWKGVQQDGEKGKSRLHQSQKPEAVMSWCLSLIPESNVIIDPFMGSGTTGVSAIRDNRYFIGIEKDDKYFAIAAKRLADCASQGMLNFTEEPDDETDSSTK